MGLGNYIHYFMNDYRRYSILNSIDGKHAQHRVSAGLSAWQGDATNAYRDTKERLREEYQRNGVNRANAKSLEDKLNQTKQKMADIQKAIENKEEISNKDRGYEQAVRYLTEYIGQNLPGLSLDIGKLTASIVRGDIKAGLRNAITKYTGLSVDKKTQTVSTKSETMLLSTITDRFIVLADAYLSLQNLVNTQELSSAAQKRITSKMEEIDRVSRDLSALYREAVKIANGKARFSTTLSNGQLLTANGKSVAEILYSFNKLAQALTAPSSKEAEIVGEGGLAALAYTAVNNGAAAGANLIQSFIQGTKPKTTVMHFDKTLFFTKIDVEGTTGLEHLSNLINADKEGNIRKTWQFGTGVATLENSTAGVIDIAVSVGPTAQSEIGTDKIYASVKNYKSLGDTNQFKHGIKIIETSLLSILMMTTEPFANHYLNIMGAHPVLGSTVGAGLDQTSLGQDYAEAIKFALIVRGFTGARNLGANQGPNANFFILNDSTTGHITVLSITDILTTLDQTTTNLNTFIQFGDMPSNLQQYNKWVSAGDDPNNHSQASAVTRIVNYLAAIHGIKLKASIAPNFYENIGKLFS